MHLTLKQKLIIVTLLTTTLIYGASFSYVLYRLKAQNKRDAEEIVMNNARMHANEISAQLNQEMGVVKGLVASVQQHDQWSVTQKKARLDLLIKNTLALDESYKGTWYAWQLSSFDPRWGNKPGRVSGAFMRKKNNEVLQAFDSLDIGGIQQRNNYHKMMDTKREAIMEPYNDISLGVVVTTLAMPVLHKDNFAGLIGIDLELSHFQDIISEITPYETGYAFLLSNKAAYVYHPDSSIIGQTFAQVNTEEDSIHAITEFIRQGKELSLYASHTQIESEIFVYFTPVRIADTGTPWSMGVLVFMDEVLKESNQVIRNAIIVGIIGLLILLAILVWFTSSVFRSVNKGVAYAQAISKGDLTARLDVHSNDEMGKLADALRVMVEQFKDMVRDMKSSALQMEDFAMSQTDKSDNYESMANQQEKAANAITTSLNEISSNIKLSHTNTTATQSISKKATEELRKGNELIQKTIWAMKEIADKIGVIGEIASRTDLLAINASIEASRAGEQGRGFSVVADEVRKLSERSTKAAEQINELSVSGVNISTDTGKMIEDLLPEIEKTAALVQEVAALSNEQNQSIDSIIRAMEELNNMACQNTGVASEMSANAEKFNQLSGQLKTIINRFKTE